MISRIFLLLLLMASGGGHKASAQQPACDLFSVDGGLLNISKTAGGTIYIDVIEKGEIVCISRQAKSRGKSWGLVTYKIEKDDKRTDVDGWAMMSHLTKLATSRAAAIESKAKTPTAQANPVTGECKRFLPSAQVIVAVPCESTVGARTTPSTPSASTTPSPSMRPSHTSAATDPDNVLRFTQPVPFGPFPVNGRSLKELAESQPLFPPLEGIPDEMWKKPCATCHKWNQARLCEQGKTYAQSARQVLRHQHPFGGAYKIALMKWAKSGCN
jgi:hypothetical protein